MLLTAKQASESLAVHTLYCRSFLERVFLAAYTFSIPLPATPLYFFLSLPIWCALPGLRPAARLCRIG
jgi:hypothetical protein